MRNMVICIVVCLFMLTVMSCGGGTPPADEGSRAGDTEVEQPPGSGGDGQGGSSGGGGGLEDPHPEEPKDIMDLGEGIGPWGEVIATHEVEVNGQIYIVNQLSSSDPFTAVYQLEDGTLVVSNEPLEDIVLGIHAPPPPVIDWESPDGDMLGIYEGEILVSFASSATRQDIEQIISGHNLHVITSWFEPAEPPATGNTIAWFTFMYDQGEFPAFDDALAFFSSHPLVESASPNVAESDPGNVEITTLEHDGYVLECESDEFFGIYLCTAYFPYVESVYVPTAVVEGNDLHVTLRFSTQLRPQLLNGLSWFETASGSYGDGKDGIIYIIPFLWKNTDRASEPVYEHTIKVSYTTVRQEMVRVRVLSADSPEWGGLEGKVHKFGNFSYEPHPHLVWQEYPITVLPAEPE